MDLDETPTNPMLKLADLEAIASEARARGILTACDNTFCSPMLQKGRMWASGSMQTVVGVATRAPGPDDL